MTYNLIQIPVEDLNGEELVGRNEREVKMLAKNLMAVGTVLYPIQVQSYRNSYKVIDGTKRVLACQWILENVEDESVKDKFRTIEAIQRDKMKPEERAALSIIGNEFRSDNPISAYLHMRDMKKKGKWEELQKLYKLNKSRFKRLATLENLEDQDLWFEAFEEGQVAMGTIFSVAKLSDARQKLCEDKLQAEEKLTGGDVRDIRSTAAEKVLSGLDLSSSVPKIENSTMFVYVNGDNVSKLYKDFTEAQGSDEKGTLCKLVPIGAK